MKRAELLIAIMFGLLLGSMLSLFWIRAYVKLELEARGIRTEAIEWNR